MNDNAAKPVSPSSQSEKASDTSHNALEATGSNPVPLSESAEQGTVASNHPRRPHPSATGEFPHIAGYIIAKMLGEGGMGAVFLAEDERLGRKVAIKTMKREFVANQLDRERFLREARAAAAIEHDNIVPILHIGEATDDTPFIVMPLLKGESLADRLSRNPVASPDFILKVAGEVAEGLAAAHANGLIHRDIKPANIWLEGDGDSVRRCKILDFGLARSVGKDDAQITASGAILGTPAFMAPEQARGEKLDARADLFSLGVVLYRMATGKLPFDGPTAMAVLISLTTETPPPVRQLAPNLPPQLAGLIDRLMCKDREGRPQSAEDVVANVHQIRDNAQQPSVTPRAANTRPRVAKRSAKPWLIAAVCLLTLVAAGLGLRTVLNDQKPDSDVVKNTDSPKPPNPTSENKQPPEDKQPPENKQPEAKKEPEHDPKKPQGPELVKPGQELVKPGQGLVNEPKLDAERKAALWVLTTPNAEGTVSVSGDGEIIKAVKDLPKKPFTLAAVSVIPKLDNNMKLLSAQNADLAVFKDCTNITSLYLAGDGISNEGLSHFGNCKNLKSLYLSGTKVNDKSAAIIKQFTKLEDLTLGATDFTEKGVLEVAAGLPGCRIQYGYTIEPATEEDRKAAEYALSKGGRVSVNYEERNIKDLKELPKETFRLTIIDLTGTNVTDADLVNFKDCNNLVGLGLRHTQVTDAGLVNFKDCKKLVALDLDSTDVTDKGLVNFKDCNNLAVLNLNYAKVTDAGLANFKDCKKLTTLCLFRTQVSDKGLEQIKQYTELEILELQQTQVTKKGINDLAKVLLKCEIGWDGGTIKPQEK